MQKVLRKRIWRDFKSNLPRYLALSLLIILAMYLVVSLVGAAERSFAEVRMLTADSVLRMEIFHCSYR